METTTPNTSLELDTTSTGTRPVSTNPATAAAVINPNNNKEMNEKEKKKVRKVRPLGKDRTDHDRPRHMTNARNLHGILAQAREPLVGQSLEAMERIHLYFRRSKLAERRLAAEWKVARSGLHTTIEQAGQLIAYCARKVRSADEDSWTARPEVDQVEAEAREKKLLNGFLPSGLRDPSNLAETLEHLARILVEDPAETGRWNPRYIETVQQSAYTLRKALDRAGQTGKAHGAALKRLRRARAQWDLCWSILERTVVGWFSLLDRRDEVEAAFQPIRLRGTPRLTGAEPGGTGSE